MLHREEKSSHRTFWEGLPSPSGSTKGVIKPLDFTLLPQEEEESEITIAKERATIRNGKITAEIDSKGSVRYLKPNGEVLLEELWIDGTVQNADLLKARNYKARSPELFRISVYFKAHPEEQFLGMGRYANDCLNLKRCVLELAQRNTQISITFLLSSRGYGFIWDNPSIGRAELARNHTMWYAEAAR